MSRRLFVAIEIPEVLKNAIERSRPRIERHLGTPFRWTSTGNLHVTLAFLGGVPEEDVPLIESACSEAASRVNAFKLTTDILGCFPNPRKARILWLGLSGTSDIQELYDALIDRLEPLGFTGEKRPYHPHITIARAKRIGPVAAEEMSSEIEIRHEVPVENVTLFESILRREGARYLPLRRFKLGFGSGV